VCLTGFTEPESGCPELPKQVAAGILERKGAVHLPQPQGAYAGIGQSGQGIGRRAATPDRELIEHGIGFIDPAVAIAIESGEIAEAITAFGAKQFIATISTTIAVAVQYQIAATAGEPGQALLFAIAIEIEIDPFAAQLGRLAGKVEHQRILQHHAAILIPGTLGALTTRQGHLEIEGNATPVGGFDLAGTTDLQLFAFANDLAPLACPGTQAGRRTGAGLLRQTAIATGRAAFPAFKRRQYRFQQLLKHACETFAWAVFGFLQLHLVAEYLPETVVSTEFDAVLALRLMLGGHLDFG